MPAGMRNALVIFATLVTTTTLAAAEPTAYVGTGAMAGMDGFLDAQVAIEGGVHLQGQWWLHAIAATGGATDDQGGGPVSQARVGIEGRACNDSGAACAYAGLDVGYQSLTWRPHDPGMDENYNDMIAAYRAGGDLGGRHVRVRPGVELLQRLAGSDTYVRETGAPLGLNLTLALAYQW
jgi:hypothetical protein